MADQQDDFPVPRGPLALLLAAAFLVSPILFFTGLTRNPYFLQIALVNWSFLGAAALFLFYSVKRGRWLLPSSYLSKPLAALALVYLFSFAWSWLGHRPFFRPAMQSEGLKAAMFFLTNCLGAFYLALALPYSGKDEPPAGKWLAFIAVWGLLWFLFPWLKVPPAGDSFFDHFFDPYGFLVWTSGITAVWLLIRRCRQEDILHLAMTAGAVASLYGILQYFRLELVWAKLLNPYGNRSVSTFGNPNFISTYVVIFMPLAASLLMRADTTVKRVYYGLVFLSYEGMLMASLTRSSWIGAAAAFAFLFAFASHRARLKANRKFLYPFFAAALLLLFFWPADNLKPLSSGLAERVSEAASGIGTPAAVSLSGDNGRIYSSFHQRLLIWTSAWQMGLQNPLLGNGWGQFELFYPFFQGRLLVNYPVIRNLRTHANNAHNEVLEQFSQAGLIGLGVYVWFLAALSAGFLRYYRSSSEDARYSAVPLAAGLVGALADNMLNVSLHFAVPAAAFWWVAGALALKTTGSSSYPEWKRPRAAAAAAWALIALCAAGAWSWERQFEREYFYFKGFRAMRANAVPAAVEALRAAWQAHPRDVNADYEYANAYVRSGDLQKGVWAYGEALKSNAGYDEIYFNLAIVLKRLGRQREALDYLRVSSEINPLNLTAWQAMAEIYVSMPDKAAAAAAAVKDFREAVSVFPEDPSMWNTLGYFHTLLKDFRAARDDYFNGASAAPDDRVLAENLVGVSRQLGMKDDPYIKWLAEYQRLARSAPSAAVSAADIAAADALRGTRPDSRPARMLRAKLYFKAGRLDEASAALLELLRERDSDNQARYGLAVIYEKEGKRDLARAAWEDFLRFEPGNSAVRARLEGLR